MPDDHGREDEHYGHQRRRPPGIGLDRAEDESYVAVQQERRGNADQRDNPADLLVDMQRALADVARAQRHDLVDHAQQAFRLLRQNHNVAPVVEPDLEDQHRHQVPQVHIAEHRHGRRACGVKYISGERSGGPGGAAAAAARRAERPAPSAAPAGKSASPPPRGTRAPATPE
jgi:hypothetical protein